MSGKREALATAATVTKAMDNYDFETNESSEENYTISDGFIARFLPCGKNNAISTKTLLNLTKLKTPRELQQAIESERKHGAAILTNPTGGYYLPAEDAEEAIRELKGFIQYMTRKGHGCLRSAKPARKLLADLQREADGQQRLEL